ncbi:MAG: hypothetical protein AB1782_13440 [Cyanobacteriota bacterium]
MLKNLCCTTTQTLRSQFISKLRDSLYDREDFTQGEYIEALDQIRQIFQKDETINHEELDEIIKSLTHEWKDIGEIIRTDNQTKRVHHSIAIIVGVTALITAIVSWFIFRKKN